MAAITHTAELSSSASPTTSGTRRWPTSWWGWRTATPTVSTATSSRARRRCSPSSAPRRLRAAAGAAARKLIEAREKAFWTAKAAGADDIIDVVVPRLGPARLPRRRVRQLAARTGSWCRRLRPRRRRQRAPRRVPEGRGVHGTVLLHEHLRRGHGAGRRHLRRARHRTGQEATYFLELEDPAKIELMRRIKRGIRPRRDPQPRRALRPGGLRNHGRMNGAQALIRTLVDAGVDVCFTNPGTSEMHFVAALDDVPADPWRARPVRRCGRPGPPTATGAWPDKPAATLLHLGPGLGNGLANLHNARRGAHPDRQHRRRPRHLPQAVRRAAWSPTSRRWRATLNGVGASIVEHGRRRRRRRRRRSPRRRTRPGQVATLILPADVSWGEGGTPAAPVPPTPAAARWRRTTCDPRREVLR